MQSRIWAIVPAAGLGRRYGSNIPKQYVPLAGRAVLYRSLDQLAKIKALSGIAVGLHPDDTWWNPEEVALAAPIRTFQGGSSRMETVRNGLQCVIQEASEDVFALVHDGARPLPRVSDIERLLEVVGSDVNGGLLACPCTDTLKKATTKGTVVETVARETLWQAVTPQLFPAAILLRGLMEALEQNLPCTDEAQAMERLGFAPTLVESDRRNIKITTPEDIALAEALFNLSRSQ